MPRRKRGWEPGACYHVTHRCWNQEFLFRYAKYRNYYIRNLFHTVRKYRLDVLDYIVTSNHVHLLVAARKGDEISKSLQYLHGRMGQWHNMQKSNSGSFWADRFHATRIQSGGHLAKCLLYIDLNMVRAGAVGHPSEWAFSAYQELQGKRQRCRIINRERLLQCLGMNEQTFKEWHQKNIEEKITRQELTREKFWSSSTAVGDEDWLETIIKKQNLKRRTINSTESSCYIAGTRGHFSK